MVGLRTGFCGSLTTFASWELSLVTLLIGGDGIQGGQWAEFLWGLIIGFQLSLSSYMFGAHLAANLDYLYSSTATKRRTHTNEVKGTSKKAPAAQQLNSSKPGALKQGVGSGGVEYEGSSAGQAGWDLEERGQVGGENPDSDGWREEEEGKVQDSKPQNAAEEHQRYKKVSAASLLLRCVLCISMKSLTV